jgi:hypothetical protein
MSDVRVVALQPVFDHINDTVRVVGEEWVTTTEFAEGLIALEQLHECKEPSLLVVPEVGLYLPTEEKKTASKAEK